MLDQKTFIGKNWHRLAAMPVVLTGMCTAAYSTLQHEKSPATQNRTSHPFFDITSAIMGSTIILNALGRAHDHHANEMFRKNMPWAFFVLLVQLAQMGCSIASAAGFFEQPVTLPPTFGSLTILGFSLLNWKPVSFTQEHHHIERLQKNWARILGGTLGSASGAIALTSICTNEIPIQRAYFASSLLGSLAAMSESWQRCFDILYFDAQQHNVLNKIFAVLFTLFALINAVVSGLATFAVIALPDATNFLFIGGHLLSLMIAQLDFGLKQPMHPLLQSVNAEEGDVNADTESDVSHPYVPPVLSVKSTEVPLQHGIGSPGPSSTEPSTARIPFGSSPAVTSAALFSGRGSEVTTPRKNVTTSPREDGTTKYPPGCHIPACNAA